MVKKRQTSRLDTGPSPQAKGILLGDIRQTVKQASAGRRGEEVVHDVECQRVGEHANVLRDVKHAVVLDLLVID